MILKHTKTYKVASSNEFDVEEIIKTLCKESSSTVFVERIPMSVIHLYAVQYYAANITLIDNPMSNGVTEYMNDVISRHGIDVFSNPIYVFEGETVYIFNENDSL